MHPHIIKIAEQMNLRFDLKLPVGYPLAFLLRSWSNIPLFALVLLDIV
jgi:hypothetical protein